MKKLAILVASFIVLFGATTNASAQGIVAKGGLSYSNISANIRSIGTLEVRNYSGWHFGLGYQTESIMGFTFQPELIYNVKGSSIGDIVNWKMSYLQLPVNVQYGIDLLVARPFIFAAPYVGYSLSNRVAIGKGGKDAIIEGITSAAKRFEYGIGIGAGVDFWKLQITAKYNWNFGEVTDINKYLSYIKTIDRNATSFELSVGFHF